MSTDNKLVDIFAVGNVLDPHIEIKGECLDCKGSGALNGDTSKFCESCHGKGTAHSLVRLSDLITAPGPALKYIESKEE